jgi:hypothetical protein
VRRPARTYSYPTPAPPTRLEIMLAIETLLRAGYSAEMIPILLDLHGGVEACMRRAKAALKDRRPCPN